MKEAGRPPPAGPGPEPVIGPFTTDTVTVEPRPVGHASHPTVGYLIRFDHRRVAWAPEFWVLPDWVAGVDLL